MTRASVAATRRSWRTALIVAVILLPVWLIYAQFAVVEPIQKWAADDLAINYSAAAVLRSGGLLYDADALRAAHESHIGPPRGLYSVLFLTYNNTPGTALLFWPLTYLDFATAQTVFVILNNVLYVSGIGLVLYALRARAGEVMLCVTICLLAFFYAARQTFGLGQMNGVLVFLMAAALALTLSRRDVAAGGVIAVAAILKISPVLLLGFFVAQRRWRALWGAVAAGAALLAVMLIGAGQPALGHFVTQIMPALGRGSAAFPNQSVLGTLYRLVVPLAEIQSSGAMGDYPAVRALWLVIAIGLAVTTLVLTARARLAERGHVAVAFSVYIVLGLIAGGLAWDHYLLWLALPVCALIVDWFRDRWLRPIGFWGPFILALFAISVPTPILEQFYFSIGALGAALPLIGLLMLLGLMWRRLQMLHVAV